MPPSGERLIRVLISGTHFVTDGAVDFEPVKGWASSRGQLPGTLVIRCLVTGGLAATTRLARTVDPCEQVLIASSQEKASMLQGFAVSYDAGRPQVGGRCVTVSVEKVDSGDAELALANGWTGSTRPDVWSPASSAWVNLLTAQAPAVAAQLLPASPDQPVRVTTRDRDAGAMAKALGYPTKADRLGVILKLAQDPQGWAHYGHPEWGKFKLGKTNPTISTSGLHALIGAYYAAPGGADLTVPSVNSAPVKAFVREIEASVVHYGQTATDFLQNLRYADDQGGEAPYRYISAIAVEEQELADYNAGLVAGVQHSPPHVKLVAIYPLGGTLVADHPYVVLGWSTDGQKAAARDFEDFIAGQWRTIEARHFRIGNAPTAALAKLVYQGAQPPPLLALAPPAGDVLKDHDRRLETGAKGGARADPDRRRSSARHTHRCDEQPGQRRLGFRIPGQGWHLDASPPPQVRPHHIPFCATLPGTLDRWGAHWPASQR